MQTEAMNKEFGISNKLSFAKYEHTTIANIQSDYSKAKISLYGAQVLSFINEDNEELLFMSSECIFKNGKAIRGGIPVCWPWFGANTNDPSLPSHGFARTTEWEVIETIANDEVTLVLGLKSNEDTLKVWPHQFEAQLKVVVGKKLSVSLSTTNKDSKAFEVSAALHTYFLINDIATTKLEGLASKDYFNNVNKENETQNETILSFGERIDRHYCNTNNACIIDDTNKKIVMDKDGSETTVVWNPGKELCIEMADLGDTDYKKMLCVESTNSLNNIITIQPNQTHTLSTYIYKQ